MSCTGGKVVCTILRWNSAATAAEVSATGIDWSFAPALAVVPDDRWGRTCES